MVLWKNLSMISCGMTNCWIIRGSRGDILIDTGLEEYRSRIELWLQSYGYNVSLIILTHGHADHIQNAAYFSRKYGAPIMISPYDMRLARDNASRHYYITSLSGWVMRNRCKRNMRLVCDRFEPDIFAEDGMDLSPYGIEGTVVSLEGHTKGSIGVLHNSSYGRDLYVGDAVCCCPIPSYPMICESPAAARRSIERIITIAPDRILSGHGGPVCCGDKKYELFAGRF